jgi:transposase
MTGRKKAITYSREFQDNAVRLAKMPSRTVASVAAELKIPAWKLRLWIKNVQDKEERSSDMDELNKLRNELRDAKEEIAILKKAAAYFAKNLPLSTLSLSRHSSRNLPLNDSTKAFWMGLPGSM